MANITFVVFKENQIKNTQRKSMANKNVAKSLRRDNIMKRKITDLEQRLIDNGYYLSHKSYSGRKSEKTLSYTYVCQNKFVRLDYKREKVITYGLLNYHAMELTEMELQGIKLVLSFIRNDTESGEKDDGEPTLD